MVCAADMVLATAETFFCFPEARLGLCPSVVSPWVVRVMGASAARYYFLTAERISADSARSLGIIHQLVRTGNCDHRD